MAIFGNMGAFMPRPDPTANAMPNPYPGVQQAAAMAPPGAGVPPMAAKKGFHDPGGMGEKLMLFGAMLQNMGGSGAGNPIFDLIQGQRHDTQRQQFLTEEADRKRGLDWQDWVAQQQYETEHPKPTNNDTVNDYQFILQTRGKAAADGYLDAIAAGPPISVRNPDGTYQIIPRSMISGGAGQPAPQPAPPGVTFTPMDDGGAGPQTPRRFP